MSHSSPEGRQNSADNVFGNIRIGREEASLFAAFLSDHDFSDNTQRAMIQDVRKLARWFVEANKEPFVVGRVTTRDVSDFRDDLRRNHGQAVATVNRALVTVRRFFNWLVEHEHLVKNPASKVKELRRTELAPKGLAREEVRKLLRELELRQDVRGTAIFALLLHTGARVGDVVALELDDLLISERSGTAVFRHGKGRKQRSVPLPLACRRALLNYLETRPPVDSLAVFLGERGPLGERGIRALCDKYSVWIGVKLHPHLLRHTFAHNYLEANPGDLVGLAQILGHSNLNTTARYTKQTQERLGEAVERVGY